MHADEKAMHEPNGLNTAIMSACGSIAAILIGIMALLVGADITLRALGMGNLVWVNEVIEYMITGATFIGAPWVLHQHGHVNIDIIVSHLPTHVRYWVDLLANVVCLLISGVMLYECVLVLLDARESGALLFKTLVFPEWYLFTPAVICFALFVFEFANRLWRMRGL